MKMVRKAWKDLSEGQKQRLNGELVHREVFACVSQTTDYLLSKEDPDAPFSWEDVDNLYLSYEEAKRDGVIGEDVAEEDYEAERQEVFEWWLVSTWLIEKLRELGEPVILDFEIWGRCTTGQSISIDSVIYKITEERWDEGYYFNEAELNEDYYEGGDKE